MSSSHTGNVQPQLDLEEHQGTAQAKRVVLFGLDPDTGQFVAPTVFDYSSANPLAVVLTHPGTGTAYSATTTRLFENRSTFPTATFHWISDTAGLLAASNATRSTLIVQNDFGASHSLFVGPYTVDLDLYGMELRAGGVFRDAGPIVYNGNLFGVLLTTATTATVRARVLETH